MNTRCYHERMDWWSYVASLPQPRIMVLEDMDRLSDTLQCAVQ